MRYMNYLYPQVSYLLLHTHLLVFLRLSQLKCHVHLCYPQCSCTASSDLHRNQVSVSVCHGTEREDLMLMLNIQ